MSLKRSRSIRISATFSPEFGDAGQALLQKLDQRRAVPQIGERVAARDQLDPGERGVTGNDVLEHRPADDDDAEKERADEDGEHGVHDVEAQQERDEEWKGRE